MVFTSSTSSPFTNSHYSSSCSSSRLKERNIQHCRQLNNRCYTPEKKYNLPLSCPPCSTSLVHSLLHHQPPKTPSCSHKYELRSQRKWITLPDVSRWRASMSDKEIYIFWGGGDVGVIISHSRSFVFFSLFFKKNEKIKKKDLWSAAAGCLEGGSVGALLKNLTRKNKKARADCSPLCQ